MGHSSDIVVMRLSTQRAQGWSPLGHGGYRTGHAARSATVRTKTGHRVGTLAMRPDGQFHPPFLKSANRGAWRSETCLDHQPRTRRAPQPQSAGLGSSLGNCPLPKAWDWRFPPGAGQALLPSPTCKLWVSSLYLLGLCPFSPQSFHPGNRFVENAAVGLSSEATCFHRG